MALPFITLGRRLSGSGTRPFNQGNAATIAANGLFEGDTALQAHVKVNPVVPEALLSTTPWNLATYVGAGPFAGGYFESDEPLTAGATLPAGRQAGDLIVAVASSGLGGSANIPDGYSRLGKFAFYKYSDGTERSVSFTFPTTGQAITAARAFAFRNIEPGYPFDSILVPGFSDVTPSSTDALCVSFWDRFRPTNPPFPVSSDSKIKGDNYGAESFVSVHQNQLLQTSPDAYLEIGLVSARIPDPHRTAFDYKVGFYDGAQSVYDLTRNFTDFALRPRTNALRNAGARTATVHTIATGQWSVPVYGGGRWVVLQKGTSTQAASSADGVNWTTATLPSGNWVALAHNAYMGGSAGTWLAITAETVAASSIDGGLTWTTRTLPGSNHSNVIAYVFSDEGNLLPEFLITINVNTLGQYTRNAGASWTTFTTGGDVIRAIGSDGYDGYVWYGNAGLIKKSTAGWLADSGAPTDSTFFNGKSPVYEGGRFWTTDSQYNQLSYSPSSTIFSSVDGKTWVGIELTAYQYWNSVAADDNKVIISGESPVSAYSSDGGVTFNVVTLDVNPGGVSPQGWVYGKDADGKAVYVGLGTNLAATFQFSDGGLTTIAPVNLSTSIELAASLVVASSTTMALLPVGSSFGAQGQASASVVAELTAPAIVELTGDSTTLCTASAELSTGILLSASVQVVSTATATPPEGGAPAALEGTLACSSALTAAVTTSILLSGSLLGVVASGADLTASIRAQTSVAVLASVTADITTAIRLSANGNVVTTALCVVTTAISLLTNVKTGALVAASLTTGVALASDLVSQASTDASLSSGISLIAESIAQVDCQVNLSSQITLDGVALFEFLALANLDTQITLDSQIAIVFSVDAKLRNLQQITGSLTCTSTAIGIYREFARSGRTFYVEPSFTTFVIDLQERKITIAEQNTNYSVFA